jgi:transcriptional regulator with XRE-family HTH domain
VGVVEALGSRIREARRDAGYSNAESLAVALGVGVRTMQRWEQGASEPSIEKLIEISQLTGKPVGFFLNGADA